MTAEVDRIRSAYARRRDDARYAAVDLANLFRLQGVERGVLNLLAQHGVLPLRSKRILEIGCGTGYWLREFVRWGADPPAVMGVDLLSDRIASAKRYDRSGTHVFPSNAADLPFPAARFDVVGQFTVFTSILDTELKHRVANEAVRVLKPGGVVLWYDFFVANPQNPDVRGVGRREIAGLFPGCAITLRRATLAPPLTRLLVPRSWLICTLLETIPLLRTHYLGVIRKP